MNKLLNCKIMIPANQKYVKINISEYVLLNYNDMNMLFPSGSRVEV